MALHQFGTRASEIMMMMWANWCMSGAPIIFYNFACHYTLCNKARGYIGFTLSVCLSVCLCLFVCPLTFRVRPVASTVQDGFFPYVVQMINSMRGCVACDDPWPWPISSRSLGLDLENRVCSVASTVLDGFFLYLAQMITIIRGCVACYVCFQNLEILIFGKFYKFFSLDLEKKDLQFSMDSFHIWHKWSLVWEGVLHVMTFDLDLYLQGYLALTLKIVSAL